VDSAVGYYSIIRYMHSIEDGEFANVGVFIICKDLKFSGYIMDSNFARAELYFSGRNNWKSERLKDLIESFGERLDYEFNDCFEVEYLKRFVVTRANHMIMSEPRGIKISVPQKQLEDLHERMVKS